MVTETKLVLGAPSATQRLLDLNAMGAYNVMSTEASVEGVSCGARLRACIYKGRVVMVVSRERSRQEPRGASPQP